MKKVKIGLIFLTFLVAIIGIVAARAREKNRSTSTTAYFQNCSNTAWHSVTLQYQLFDDVGITYQAAFRLDDGDTLLLWATQSVSTPVKFNCP